VVAILVRFSSSPQSPGGRRAWLSDWPSGVLP
jgi:hypothetical protein